MNGRPRLFTFLLISVVMFTSVPCGANAAVRQNDRCAKAGQVAKSGSRYFKCTKISGRLIWRAFSKKISPSTTTPIEPVFAFTTYCDQDSEVPNQWTEFQQRALAIGRCLPPYRYVRAELTEIKPQTVTSTTHGLLPVSSCKLRRDAGMQQHLDLNHGLHPNLRVMVVPFATADFPATSDPRSDWGAYIEWIRDALGDMTDAAHDYRFDIADTYFSIASKLTDFRLAGDVGHGDPLANDERYRLMRQIVEAADPHINFGAYDYIFFVSPRSVRMNVLANQIGWGQHLRTDEKVFGSSYITSYPDDFPSKFWTGREPFGFLHEIMHITSTAEDYYGDFDAGGSELGGGSWGNMSDPLTDHFLWDKWNAKMIEDGQVRCVSAQEESMHWIKPSTIQGSHEKLVMVPLNAHEAIAIQSIRGSGFNYKIPPKQWGALVYLINTQQIDDSVHGNGLKVYCPTNRPCTKLEDSRFGGFKLSGATLKLGDFLVLRGLRISVVEAGDFGDVVKIEPA